MIRLNLKVYDRVKNTSDDMTGDIDNDDNYICREFQVLKIQTLEEITPIILEQFGYDINKVNYRRNLRFRAFDEKKKTKLSVYDQYD